MSQRDSQLLWLRDVLDHVQECREQLEWTDDPEAARMLLDSMMQDLDCSKRLCADIRLRRPGRPVLARCA